MSARTIHPFPARMAPGIALDAIPKYSSGGRLSVIDPMCGSGTVLTAAVSRGQNAIGIDIDPLAVMMSRVATTHVEPTEFAEAALEVSRRALQYDGEAPWTDTETDRFVDFWFGPRQRRDLIAITSAIGDVEDSRIREALRVALSRIIVTKSPQASLAADTSHSRPHRTISESNYDSIQGFLRSTRSLEKLLKSRNPSGSCSVYQGDSRELHQIAPGTADLAVTSPPYLNALDYMRGHKLALVWFGYSIGELRKLRGNSIGAERAPDGPVSPEVSLLVNFIEQDVIEPDKLPFGTLRRFAGDMTTFSTALHRVLKPESRALLVIGNSTLKGNYIKNDRVAQLALENAGFEFQSKSEREIPMSSRYMPFNRHVESSSLNRRMRTEILLEMKRSPE